MENFFKRHLSGNRLIGPKVFGKLCQIIFHGHTKALFEACVDVVFLIGSKAHTLQSLSEDTVCFTRLLSNFFDAQIQNVFGYRDFLFVAEHLTHITCRKPQFIGNRAETQPILGIVGLNDFHDAPDQDVGVLILRQFTERQLRKQFTKLLGQLCFRTKGIFGAALRIW